MPDGAAHPAARRMQTMTPEQAEHHKRRIAEGRRAAAEERARQVQAARAATGPVNLTLIAYDVAMAAALTSTSERIVRRAIAEGALEARKMGRRVLIENAALRRWIASMAKLDPGAADRSGAPSSDPEAA